MSNALKLALAWAALVLYARLFPFTGWRWPPGQTVAALLLLPWPPWFDVVDVWANLLGYLPLGVLRMRTNGGAGGQKGMASVLECLRTQEIARLRLGIAPMDPAPAADLDRVEFVLARFTPAEQALASEQVARAVEACETWLAAGPADAMNRFNRDRDATA